MKLKKGDVIFLISLLVVGIAVFVAMKFFAHETPGNVLIKVAGKKVYEVHLNTIKDNQIYKISLPNGNYVNTEISRDGVRVIDASCPDKICKKSGKITYSGQTIVCLPNKVEIILTGGAKNQVDQVAY